MRRGDRAVLLRELAMIEPHGVDAAVSIGHGVLPAAVAGRIAARHRRRLRERPAAVLRARLHELRAARALRGPDDGDGRVVHRDARRLLAVQPRIAVHVVDADRRAERAAAVAADGGVDVGRPTPESTRPTRSSRSCRPRRSTASRSTGPSRRARPMRWRRDGENRRSHPPRPNRPPDPLDLPDPYLAPARNSIGPPTAADACPRPPSPAETSPTASSCCRSCCSR